jgi:hypothetical protein
MTFGWHRKGHDPLAVEEEEPLLHKTVPLAVIEPVEPVEAQNEPKYEQDDGPLTEEQIEQLKKSVESFAEPISGDLASAERFGLVKAEADDMVDKWNQMLQAAEEEARKEKEAAEEAAKWAAENPETPEAVEATEWAHEQDLERPGDYVTPPVEEEDDSKKKTTYMIKQQGEMITREKK